MFDNKAYQKEYYQQHREDLRRENREYAQEHQEERKAYARQYRKKHLEQEKIRSQHYYEEHKEGKYIKSRSTLEKQEKHRIQRRESDKRLKIKVLSHYGNGNFACIICAESRFPCLSIDHIEGNGAKEREELQVTGAKFYRWLKKNNYPEGYQTLCMNCQWVKKYENKEYSTGSKPEIVLI